MDEQTYYDTLSNMAKFYFWQKGEGPDLAFVDEDNE